MSGTTIGNWGKFEKNLFKGMSGIPDKDVKKITNDETGVLSARLSEVKSGHLHASTVKKFFLGILTFGIYNICHGISAKNQRATKAALKEGVDNVLLSPENAAEALARVPAALGPGDLPGPEIPPEMPRPEAVLPCREAMLAPQELLSPDRAVGRICASPTVGCPPAVPILAAGERIGPEAAALLRFYGVEAVAVVR